MIEPKKIGNHLLYNADCNELLPTLKKGSVKHYVFDPPYGVLTGHKIETEIDKERLMWEINRTMDDNGFVVFFGQMPTLIDWCIEARKFFNYSDHIVWAKRSITSPYLPIQRSHEEVMIYKKGNPKYVDTKERYEDLKVPMLHCGIYEMSTIKTTLHDLYRRIEDPEYNALYSQKMKTAHGNSNDEYYQKKLDVRRKSTRNDDFHKSTNPKTSFRYRSKRDCNVTNTWSFMEDELLQELSEIWEFFPEHFKNAFAFGVAREFPDLWSYLPENLKNLGEKSENIKHPTVKPIGLMNRILNLISSEGETICDPFMGSGSTAKSALLLNRNFIGCEIDKDYFEVAFKRIKAEQEKLFRSKSSY